jgi:hypothetical protein
MAGEDRDIYIEALINELKALRLRVTIVESQLRGHREQEEAANVAPGVFVRGDRVRITNRIRRPANWSASWHESDIENERRSTVTHRVRDQVWLITDNGTRTWRAPNNLERIE